MRGRRSGFLAVVACALLPCTMLGRTPQANSPAAAHPAAEHPASAPPAVAHPPVAHPAANSSPAKNNGAAPVAKAASAKPPRAVAQLNRRDPFRSLVGRGVGENLGVKNLPPGKAGLEVATMKLRGVIHGPAGMVAVVVSPAQQVYFLHPGDQLYDGRVEQISLDGIVVRQTARDTFGRSFERTVTKQVYSAAGVGQ